MHAVKRIFFKPRFVFLTRQNTRTNIAERKKQVHRNDWNASNGRNFTRGIVRGAVAAKKRSLRCLQLTAASRKSWEDDRSTFWNWNSVLYSWKLCSNSIFSIGRHFYFNFSFSSVVKSLDSLRKLKKMGLSISEKQISVMWNNCGYYFNCTEIGNTAILIEGVIYKLGEFCFPL